MIPPRTKQFLAALLLAAVLLLPQGTLSAPSRTEAYGIVMTDDAKQLYMREKMQAFYRGTAETTPLTLPAGWTAEHEALGGVPVDRYTPARAAHPRVLLQLHGGGYIMRLGDVHRALALRLGVLMGAMRSTAWTTALRPPIFTPPRWRMPFVSTELCSHAARARRTSSSSETRRAATSRSRLPLICGSTISHSPA